jgi:hypothetical protein
MLKVGDLVSFRILLEADNTGSFWTWKEGIGHITGAVYLEDGKMFYEIVDAEGRLHDVPPNDINKL